MIVGLAIAGRETAGWQTAGRETARWAIAGPKKALKSLRLKPRLIAGLVTVGRGTADNLPMVRPSGFTQNFVKPLARTADTGFDGLFADPQNQRRIGL